jgi:hypothetical protein
VCMGTALGGAPGGGQGGGGRGAEGRGEAGAKGMAVLTTRQGVKV